ncbi:MAG: hypothetical protein EXR59_06170 [Dehalococcoidia bacterium]|nr:hypothetical protein [Dehalococcoidia bacterium]
MAVAKKRFNPITFSAEVLFNIMLIGATLLIILLLTPFALLNWLVVFGIGNIKTVGYISAGNRVLKAADAADMSTLDKSVRELLGVDEGGRKNFTAWVNEKRRQSLANKLITIRRKSFPNDKIHYL